MARSLVMAQIADLALAYGATDAAATTVVAIAWVESRGKEGAINHDKNSDGSKDYGLVQWNSGTMAHHGITVDEALDAGCALWWMQRVTNGFVDFSPWKGELNYKGKNLRAEWMAPAAAAVAAVRQKLAAGNKGATISTTRNNRPVVGSYKLGEAGQLAALEEHYGPDGIPSLGTIPGTDIDVPNPGELVPDPLAGLEAIGAFFVRFGELIGKAWQTITSAATWKRVGLGAGALALFALAVTVIFRDVFTDLSGVGALTPDATDLPTSEETAE
jgi:hypothetical protein